MLWKRHFNLRRHFLLLPYRHHGNLQFIGLFCTIVPMKGWLTVRLSTCTRSVDVFARFSCFVME